MLNYNTIVFQEKYKELNMKLQPLHLQILSYLRDKKELTNLQNVIDQFLNSGQKLILDGENSECRGKGCFQRFSDIIFAINRLQDEHQIILARTVNNVKHTYTIDAATANLQQDAKISGDMQLFLRDYAYAIIQVSEEASEYIKRGGVSKELYEAKKQVKWSIVAVIVSIIAVICSIISQLICRM